MIEQYSTHSALIIYNPIGYTVDNVPHLDQYGELSNMKIIRTS